MSHFFAIIFTSGWHVSLSQSLVKGSNRSFRFQHLVIISALPSGTMCPLFMQDLSVFVISQSSTSCTFLQNQQKCLHFAGKFIKSIIELITLIYLGLCTLNFWMHYTFKRQSAKSFDNRIIRAHTPESCCWFLSAMDQQILQSKRWDKQAFVKTET